MVGAGPREVAFSDRPLAEQFIATWNETHPADPAADPEIRIEAHAYGTDEAAVEELFEQAKKDERQADHGVAGPPDR